MVTRPRSPKITKTSSKILDRDYLNEGSRGSQPVDKLQAALLKSIAAETEKGANNPSSTKSMNLAMQRKREDLEKKRKQDEMNKKEDEERIIKQNRMKNTV